MFAETLTHSESETIAFAEIYAQGIGAKKIILLEGDLGAGKSVFARSLIRALARNPDLTVPSPTYNLVQLYDTPRGPVWHYDLYRLKDPDEMEELSWDDALSDGIVLVEWPARLGPLKPPGATTIHIDTVSGHPMSRKIRIQNED